jgi:hypothetical protein
MKQSRLFPAVLVSFMAIVFVGASHLSASVTNLDDSEGNSPDMVKLGYQDRNWPAGQTWFRGASTVSGSIATFEQRTYNPYDPGNSRVDQKIYTHTAFSQGQDFGNEMRMISMPPISGGLVSPTFGYTDKAIPDELQTLGMNFQTSIHDWSSEWNSEMHPDSEPTDDIVFDNDVDYFKAMRVPAPTSLLLVAIGLLSLRYTRRLRY